MIGYRIFNKKAIESVSNYPAGSPSAPLLFFASNNLMTSDSIETDDLPCPLTVGEWIALLAADARLKF